MSADAADARDRAYETAFLDQAERQAGLGGLGLPELVLERLDTVGAKHGDRYVVMGLTRLVREIREEGIDLAGWSVLAGQVALGPGLSREHAIEAQVLLQRIAGHGAAVENLVRQLLLLVSE